MTPKIGQKIKTAVIASGTQHILELKSYTICFAGVVAQEGSGVTATVLNRLYGEVGMDSGSKPSNTTRELSSRVEATIETMVEDTRRVEGDSVAASLFTASESNSQKSRFRYG